MKANEIQQHDIISHEGKSVYAAFAPVESEGYVSLRGVTAVDGSMVPYYADIPSNSEIVKVSKVEPESVVIAPLEAVGVEKEEEVIS